MGGSPGGLGERCSLAVSARCFLIPGLLRFSQLPGTAAGAKGAFGEAEGVQGFLDPAWNHIHMLQLRVLCQPGVVAGAAQMSPLQQGPSLLAADRSVK